MASRRVQIGQFCALRLVLRSWRPGTSRSKVTGWLTVGCFWLGSRPSPMRPRRKILSTTPCSGRRVPRCPERRRCRRSAGTRRPSSRPRPRCTPQPRLSASPF